MRKARITDFACLGGLPEFEQPLHVGAPNLGDRADFLARVNNILDRRWLTNHGVYVQEFERQLEEFLGVRHCITLCNATIALQVACRAAGLSGEVIVPSFTFVATSHALEWQGIRPVFCDIDPDTANLDPDCVEALITPETTGILGVHLWGRPCPHDRLEALARRYNLHLLYDASHALGCTWKGRAVGTLGDAEVFSFHATKFLNSCEGGAVVTNDDALAERVRRMHNFGFNRDAEVVSVGLNGKLNEISAAMGITSLESKDSFIARNKLNYHLYREGLASIPGMRLIPHDERESCNYQYIIVEVDARTTGIDRDDLWRLLHAENILAKRYFHPPCHRLEPYRSRKPGFALPSTDWLSARVLALPTGTAIESSQIATICQLLEFAALWGDKLTALMQQISRSKTA